MFEKKIHGRKERKRRGEVLGVGVGGGGATTRFLWILSRSERYQMHDLSPLEREEETGCQPGQATINYDLSVSLSLGDNATWQLGKGRISRQ